MRVLFASGGTGGHIYPGITLATELKSRGSHSVLFVGTRRGLEGELVERAGFPIRFIESAPLTGNVLKKMKNLALTGRGVGQARRLIREFKPDLVVGTGGYACGPVVLAANLAKVPVLLQEQNALPGKTNRLLSRGAKLVALGYGEAAPFFPKGVQQKLVVTGNPIRALGPVQTNSYGLDPNKTTILLMGASQGARRLNEGALGLYELAAKGQIQLLHQTGAELFAEAFANLEELAKGSGELPEKRGEGALWRGVHLYPYLYEMGEALARADLVICRAGAITLSEITAMGLPAILVPYPYAAQDHQTENARALAQNGAAILVPDREVTGERLLREVERLLANPEALAKMSASSKSLGREDAAARIVDLLFQVAQ